MSSASRGLAPREGLEYLLVKMGSTGPLGEPRHGPQAGKSGDPRSQNADSMTTRSDMNSFVQTPSFAASEAAMYSASHVDPATTLCLELH